MSTTEGKPDAAAVEEMAREAAAWCAMHGLVVGDRADPVRFSPPWFKLPWKSTSSWIGRPGSGPQSLNEQSLSELWCDEQSSEYLSSMTKHCCCLSSCRDQEQFLGLGWSTLQSPCSRRVSRSPSGGRRASWPRFSTSSWIVLAWMGISCRTPCPSEFRCHVNLCTIFIHSSACKLTTIKKDRVNYSCRYALNFFRGCISTNQIVDNLMRILMELLGW